MEETNVSTAVEAPPTEPNRDYSADSLDTELEDELERTNQPSEESDQAGGIEEQIAPEDSISISSTMTLDGRCINPSINDYVEHSDGIKNIPADEFLSDSLKEEALKQTLHYSERCLFDIADKATLLRIVEHYKLDTKQFKNPPKKMEELRQALIEKIPDTNQSYHLHGNVIWPTVTIPTRYSRNSAKAEKTKREINNPATGAKSKVKMFDTQT